MKDYYKILEIDRNASNAQVKKAYRRLALKYHPDLNRDFNAVVIFREANEAYRTLSSPKKRESYDFRLFNNIPEKVVINKKYYEDNGRKYGTAYKRNAGNPNAKKQAPKKEEKVDFTYMENWMFYSLVFIGLLAIALSVRDLYQNEVKDSNAFTGIIFGLLFTFLLIYFWSQVVKKRKE